MIFELKATGCYRKEKLYNYILAHYNLAEDLIIAEDKIFIILDSLKALGDFIKRIDNEIIIGETSNNFYIEIYDDYRE